MTLPKKFWRVELVRGGHSKLRYSEKGGQTYAAKSHAQNRLDYLRHRGIECRLWGSEPVQWHMVDSGPNNDPTLF
jgi:hypothetical protein